MPKPAFQKVLIANRGEIAVRVIRACRELDLQTVAVFSEADRTALHVQLADFAFPLGPAPSAESYLRIDKLIAVARESGAQAVHPGYGFLAENAGFARACEAAGLVFIGPRSATIELMGEKTSARRVALEAGVPVVPGTLEPTADDRLLAREAERIGYPVMLKAAAGGGGKGLRFVERAADLLPSLARARSEAQGAFGDDAVYLEKALLRPHHIEIQVLADAHGNALQLFDRECSIQRRHQKVLEESPSPFISAALRERMGAMALALVHRAGYVNAGTLEFLVDRDQNPYFLEMNTRLQVEHPVTELVTGLDLVKLQIAVAQGQPLELRQADLRQTGHAIECRVYAEDPERDFMPSPGRITRLRPPAGPGIRDDSGVYEGWEVPIYYDALLSKLVVSGSDRPEALARLRRALGEYELLGIQTTLPFFERLLDDPEFVQGRYDTDLVARLLAEPRSAAERSPSSAALAAAAIDMYLARSGVTSSTPDPAASGWRLMGWRDRLADRL